MSCSVLVLEIAWLEETLASTSSEVQRVDENDSLEALIMRDRAVADTDYLRASIEEQHETFASSRCREAFDLSIHENNVGKLCCLILFEMCASRSSPRSRWNVMERQ